MNRKFDNLGRISLPKEMRDKLGFDDEHNEATVTLEKNAIVIRNNNKKDTKKEAIEYIKNVCFCEDECVADLKYKDILILLDILEDKE